MRTYRLIAVAFLALAACSPSGAVSTPSPTASQVASATVATSVSPASPSPTSYAIPTTLRVYALADLLNGSIQVTAQPVRTSQLTDATDGLTVSADGDRVLLFHERGPRSGPPPTIVRLADGARTVLRVRDRSTFFAWAGWLPDGRVLLVGGSVWLGAADGSGLREVADAAAISGGGPWIARPSPSGRYLALWAYNTTGALGFVDLTTGSTRRITGPFRRCGADVPIALAWSPDETLLAGSDCESEAGFHDARLRIVDPFGDRTTQLRRMPIMPSGLQWIRGDDLLVVQPTEEFGQGARLGAVLMDVAGTVRQRFLGIGWFPTSDGRYLLQRQPSQGYAVATLFDLQTGSSVMLRFDGSPVAWTERNELIGR